MLDLGVLLIVGLCTVIGSVRGLVLTLYSLCGKLVSLILAWRLYPVVNNFLLKTEWVYTKVYGMVASGIDLDARVSAESMKVQNELIDTLKLPEFIIESLHARNNPVLYELFEATNITEYIYSYLTTLVISALSLLLTYCVISLALGLLLKSLNMVTKLPVVSGLNRIGGAVAGAVQGLVIVFIAGAVIIMLTSAGMMPELGQMVNSSMFAYWILEKNIILNFINR